VKKSSPVFLKGVKKISGGAPSLQGSPAYSLSVGRDEEAYSLIYQEDSHR